MPDFRFLPPKRQALVARGSSPLRASEPAGQNPEVFPILPSIFVSGYILRVMRQTATGQEPTLPAWDDWGGMTRDGQGAMVVNTLQMTYIGLGLASGRGNAWSACGQLLMTTYTSFSAYHSMPVSSGTGGAGYIMPRVTPFSSGLISLG